MINLIKNELTKVFHQKSIYVIGIIIVITALLGGVLKVVLNDINLLSEDFQIKSLESMIDNYDVSKPDEKEYYIDLKASIAVLKDQKLFKESYKKNYVYTYAYESITCEIKSEIDNNNEKYKECSEEHKRIIDEIKNNDWKYFTQKEIEESKEILEKGTMDGLPINKEEIQFTIEINQYLLDNNISPDDEAGTEVVENYQASRLVYMSMNHDEKSYLNEDELNNYLSVKERYKIYEYMYNNKIFYSEYGSLKSMVGLSKVAFYVIILIALIGGTIVSKEFSKGTIKQLLVRPYSRTKILISKLIASIIVFLIALVFYDVVNIINELIFGNAKELLMPILYYNFTTDKVVEVSLFRVLFIDTLKVMPCYFIILSAAFFASTITKNDALGILCGIGLYFGGNIVNLFLALNESFLSKIVPSMCWDLSSYLNFGKGLSNLILPISIDLVTILAFIIISIVVFKKENIKNQ